MGFMKSLLSGFFLILASFLIMTKVRGPESGLYMFAINVMFVPMWGIMVLWSKGTGRNPLIRLVILTSVLLSMGAIGALVLIYHGFEVVTWMVIWFSVWYLTFIVPLYRAKRIKERSGEQLTYPSTDVKYFWFYQWLTVFVLGILPSHEPVETFLPLLPGVIGGYLIISGLIELKVGDK